MLGPLIVLIVLGALAAVGLAQLVRAAASARSRSRVLDFFEAPDGESPLAREAARLRRQADRLRRSKAVDGPTRLLLEKIVHDLLAVVQEEKSRRLQARRLLQLRQHYDALVGSARQQLAAAEPDEATGRAHAEALAEAEAQRQAVVDSLEALGHWRTALEQSAGELIQAARTTLSRARARQAHTEFAVELTRLQRSAADLLKKVLES